MVIDNIFEEVSGLLTESQFEEVYKHATSEPYNALVIDNHPKTVVKLTEINDLKRILM